MSLCPWLLRWFLACLVEIFAGLVVTFRLIQQSALRIHPAAALSELRFTTARRKVYFSAPLTFYYPDHNSKQLTCRLARMPSGVTWDTRVVCKPMIRKGNLSGADSETWSQRAENKYRGSNADAPRQSALISACRNWSLYALAPITPDGTRRPTSGQSEQEDVGNRASLQSRSRLLILAGDFPSEVVSRT